jgi:hypothetical protein
MGYQEHLRIPKRNYTSKTFSNESKPSVAVSCLKPSASRKSSRTFKRVQSSISTQGKFTHCACDSCSPRCILVAQIFRQHIASISSQLRCLLEMVSPLNTYGAAEPTTDNFSLFLLNYIRTLGLVNYHHDPNSRSSKRMKLGKPNWPLFETIVVSLALFRVS